MQKGLPKLILLDMNMPLMCGIEVLKTLRCSAIYSLIPVIMLSTSHAGAHRDECLKAGATAYFSKPSDLKGYDEIATKVVAYLSTEGYADA